MPTNPHFETARSWKAARARLTFEPRKPSYAAGLNLQSLSIHVRDHKLRDLPVGDRTLEAHYGGFVLSQARSAVDEARRRALVVSYGPSPQDALVAGREARVYELGAEPEPDDIDGRSPAVVTWHDDHMHYLVASDRLPADVLTRIATSLYE